MPDSGGEVTVWSWPLDEPAATVAALLGLLCEEERDRADRFAVEDARRRFVVGRGRLRRLLGELTGVDPRSLSFDYGPAGKPSLTMAGPCFNLAHSGERAVCAVADYPVGIDIERRRPMKNRAGLAERWFHPLESERIEAAEDPLEEFFRVWTAKEAALKLVGVGVGESLPRVLTPSDSAGGGATGLPENALGLERCHVQPLALGGSYVGALATAEGSEQVTLKAYAAGPRR